MSRNKDYQRMLNSKRWRELRAWQLERQPLCEICHAEGYVRSAVDVHHRQPVESGRTVAEMEQLCFSPSNLQSLCISCHARVHKEARSHSRDNHQQRADERLERWKARHDRPTQPKD